MKYKCSLHFCLDHEKWVILPLSTFIPFQSFQINLKKSNSIKVMVSEENDSDFKTLLIAKKMLEICLKF